MSSYQTHNRWHVTCSVCGFLGSFPSFFKAAMYGQNQVPKHATQEETLCLYDTMARRGYPQTYTFNKGVSQFECTERRPELTDIFAKS